MKKICCVLAMLVLVLCGCGGQSDGQSVGTCTVSIECYTVLDHMDQLTAGTITSSPCRHPRSGCQKAEAIASRLAVEPEEVITA